MESPLARRNGGRWFASLVVALAASSSVCAQEEKAKELVERASRAFAQASFLECVEYLKQAKKADPDSTQVRLYLGTAYAYLGFPDDNAAAEFRELLARNPNDIKIRLHLANVYATRYIPSAPSDENQRNGQRALAELRRVLEVDPRNLTAIDGIGALLYLMGGGMRDLELLEESLPYHRRHIALSPNDAIPHYWVGMIQWTLTWRGGRQLRERWNQENPGKAVRAEQVLPDPALQEFRTRYAARVDEAIAALSRAVELRPDYEDAMAYLSLVYRQKAEMAGTAAEREENLRRADAMVERVKDARQCAAASPQAKEEKPKGPEASLGEFAQQPEKMLASIVLLPPPPPPPGGAERDNRSSGPDLLEQLKAVGTPVPVEAPPKPKRMRMGGEVMAAQNVKRVQPNYPPLARQAGITGTARLRAVIGRDGSIVELSGVSGHPLLVQAAIEAVKQWRYRPTLLNGEAVEVETVIDVLFELRRY